MDNISHTLAGLITAEAALALRSRRLGAPSPLLTRVAWVTSVVANNLPDADFAYTWITGGVLGSLLHHRGHTHTLPIALLLALPVLLIPWLWGRRRKVVWARADWAVFAGLAVTGTLLHILFDGTNDYGVHPFWPLSNRWVYGDTIFIIEPWFWVTSIPLLWWTMTSRWARGLWLVPLLGILTLALLLPFMPWSIAGMLAGMALLLGILGRGWSRPRRVGTIFGLSLLAVFGFSFSGAQARETVRGAAGVAFTQASVHDLTSSPLPSNPFCWTGLLVLTEADQYVVRRYRAAPWPALWPVSACPELDLGEARTALWTRLALPMTSQVAWVEAYQAPLETFRKLARDDCRAAGLLQFARAPFVGSYVSRSASRAFEVLGDLRYDREEGLGFSELALSGAPGPCPTWLPPWEPPRSDLLALPGRP